MNSHPRAGPLSEAGGDRDRVSRLWRFRMWPKVLQSVIVGVVIGSCLAACATTPVSNGAGSGTDDPSLASPSFEPEPSSEPDEGSTTQQPRPARSPNALIVRIVDGDTVEARFRGRVLDVRLIGIDTPETVHPFEPVECFGQAASSYTTRALNGRRVHLEFDVERLDRFGRTLAYIWLEGQLFNQSLVARGFASVSTYPPNVKYVDRFLKAQRAARQTDRGLWDRCSAGSGGGGGGAGEGGSGGTGGGSSRDCDLSYPGVCIPPAPPDLDCDDVGFNNFAVKPPDPHGFDGDSDGVGCET